MSASELLREAIEEFSAAMEKEFSRCSGEDCFDHHFEIVESIS